MKTYSKDGRHLKMNKNMSVTVVFVSDKNFLLIWLKDE